MFLHPYAKTFKIDELLDTLQQARLEPILFIHPNACINTAEEIQRLRKIESNNGPSTNFIFFAGCMEDTQKRRAWQHAKQTQDICIALNPVIKKPYPCFHFHLSSPVRNLALKIQPSISRPIACLPTFSNRSENRPSALIAGTPYSPIFKPCF